MKANVLPTQPGAGTVFPTVGFTLIELQVVIAIIGILASMILASLTRAKGLADQTQCLSNIRQLLLAEKLYATDNNGTYVANQGPKVRWPSELYYEYGKNTKLLICPTDLKRGIPSTYGTNPVSIGPPPIPAVDAATRSYIFNAFNEFFSGSGYLGAMTEKQIAQPAETILISEKAHKALSFWMDDWDIWRDIQHGMHGFGLPSKSGGHLDGMNDGHAAFYKFGQDISPIDLWYVYDTNRNSRSHTTDLLPDLVP
jgi:prepilin-type N-terminal cleavage/methylation domain-containing protein